MRAWQALIELVNIIVKWLYERYSGRSKRIKEAVKMAEDGIKEQDEQEFLSGVDRLNREKQ